MRKQGGTRKRAVARMIACQPVMALSILAVGAASCGVELETDRERALASAYLNPRFSTEFIQYWQIDDYPGYRIRLVQEYFLARAEAGESSSVPDVDQTLEFQRRLMMNWLERELLYRDMMLAEFRGDVEPRNRPALLQRPLEEEVMATRLGINSERFRMYGEWADRAERDLLVP